MYSINKHNIKLQIIDYKTIKHCISWIALQAHTVELELQDVLLGVKWGSGNRVYLKKVTDRGRIVWESLGSPCMSNKFLPTHQRLPRKSPIREILHRDTMAKITNPYSILGWRLSGKSMALTGELKHQVSEALRAEGFQVAASSEAQQKRDLSSVFSSLQQTYKLLLKMHLMRWMGLLYQSSHICVGKYCFIITMIQGSASITFCTLVSLRKLYSHKQTYFVLPSKYIATIK